MWRADLIWHVSACQDEVQIIFLIISTQLFSFCPTSDLELSVLELLKSISLHHWATFKSSLPKTSFTAVFFPPWPCNLFLFLSSIVPTQKSGAQRKKLMNLSFPLKRGSWASSVCTLSGPAAVSEFHTVTTGQFCADRVRHVSYFPSVLPYLFAHLLQITFVQKLTIWKPSYLETTSFWFSVWGYIWALFWSFFFFFFK